MQITEAIKLKVYWSFFGENYVVWFQNSLRPKEA